MVSEIGADVRKIVLQNEEAVNNIRGLVEDLRTVEEYERHLEIEPRSEIGSAMRRVSVPGTSQNPLQSVKIVDAPDRYYAAADSKPCCGDIPVTRCRRSRVGDLRSTGA